jgi:hypothetical protein
LISWPSWAPQCVYRPKRCWWDCLDWADRVTFSKTSKLFILFTTEKWRTTKSALSESTQLSSLLSETWVHGSGYCKPWNLRYWVWAWRTFQCLDKSVSGRMLWSCRVLIYVHVGELPSMRRMAKMPWPVSTAIMIWWTACVPLRHLRPSF